MGLVVGLVNCDSEFGHGLQWMLTQTDNGLVAGINNVEWDAVELPSQFMENWLYSTYEVVESLSQHVETSEPLPKEIWQKIVSNPPIKLSAVRALPDFKKLSTERVMPIDRSTRACTWQARPCYASSFSAWRTWLCTRDRPRSLCRRGVTMR
jgi:hypothetical protein